MEISVLQIKERIQSIESQLSKLIVGQEEVIEQLLLCLMTGGHCLLTGVPGLGKTLLVKSISRLLSLSFKRIQFTPDLMPADIVGTEVLDIRQETGERSFRFIPGPVFANLILADEINRTPPKTQAALLEAMGEGHVTVNGKTYPLQTPFFVLATSNPVESEGVYSLPEAELDRFTMNVMIDYLPPEQEAAMVSRTTGLEKEELQAIMNAEELLELQKVVREVPVAEHLVARAVEIVSSTRPRQPHSSKYVNEMVKWGAGSRGSQALILASKARALFQGRCNVAQEDILAMALPVLRHRIVPTFMAEAEGIRPDDIIRSLLK